MRSRFINGRPLLLISLSREFEWNLSRVWDKNNNYLLFIFPVSLTKASIHNQRVLTSASPDRCLRCLTSSMRSSRNPVWAKRRQNWEECVVASRSIPLSVHRHCIWNPVLTRVKEGNSVMYMLPISRLIWRENWTLRSTKPAATAKRSKSSSGLSKSGMPLVYNAILTSFWYSCLYAWGFSVRRSRKLMMFLKSAQSFGHFWYSLQIVCKSSGGISWDPVTIIIITLMCTTLWLFIKKKRRKKKKNSRRATACVKNSLDWEKEKTQFSLHTKMTTIIGRPASFRPCFLLLIHSVQWMLKTAIMRQS